MLIEHIFMSRTRSSTLWESKILSPTPVLKLFLCCFNDFSTSEYLFSASVSLSMKSYQIIVIFYNPYSKTYISNPGICNIYLRIAYWVYSRCQVATGGTETTKHLQKKQIKSEIANIGLNATRYLGGQKHRCVQLHKDNTILKG